MIDRSTQHSTVSPRQQNLSSRRPSSMMRLLGAILCACALAACAGGSGSSGFDVSPAAENETIDFVLTQGQCQSSGELTICPANETGFDLPGQMPTPGFEDTEVSANLDPSEVERCGLTDELSCRLAVTVTAHGLPAGGTYQLAARGLEPLGSWEIADAGMMPVGEGTVIFDATIEVPSESAAFQVAVLVFFDASGTALGEISTLAETGASFAFVTDPTPIPR